MTFHDTFWLVAGTAAPVVALAAAVSLTEVNRQQRRMIDDLVVAGLATYEPEPKRSPPGTGIATYLWLSQIVNVVAQAFLLAIALLSIDYQRNVVAALIAVVIPVAGVLVIAASGIGIWRARAVADRAIRHASDGRKDQAQAQ